MWSGPYTNEFFLNSSHIYSSVFNKDQFKLAIKNRKQIVYHEWNSLASQLTSNEKSNLKIRS